MSASLEGLPSESVAYDVDRGTVTIAVDAHAYPLEALYPAAYVFIDRCYVLLDRVGDARFSVVLSKKRGTLDAESARDMVGEFANELLSCAWRAQIARDNRATIEAITAQALSGARGAPTLDELEAFDFSEEAFDDPLGIAMSWEDKYGKKKKAAAEATAASTSDAKAESTEAPHDEPKAKEPAT
jgi:His-Xaa-Ser system protein HxsD